MTSTCKRCGSMDGNHSGYHDEDELPFKRGDRVMVRAGAVIRTTHPDPGKREIVNKRTRYITVLSIDNGTSQHVEYGRTGENIWQHHSSPAVRWSGTGSYWHYASMSDVLLDWRVPRDHTASSRGSCINRL